MKNCKNIRKNLSFILLLFFVLSFSNVYALELSEEDTSYNELLSQESEFKETIIIDIEKDIINEEDTINTEEIIVEENTNNNELNEEDSIIDNDIVIEEKTKEEIFNNYSVNMVFEKDIVTVKGNILQQTITVNELLNNINIEELNKEILIEKIGITNENDTWLNSDDYVTNLCHILFIGNEFVSRYKVRFLGDLNNDNVITENDIKTGIEDFLQEPVVDTPNEENDITTIVDKTISKEVSYIDSIIDNNTYEVETPILEEDLNVSLENNEEVDKYVDDEVIVELRIDGFINNYINAISGNLNYNNEILELKNIYVLVDGEVIGKLLNNKFIYVLDNYQKNDSLLFIVFKAIGYGNTDISLEELDLIMNGTPLSILNKNKLNITINESGKGGDVELPPVEDNTEIIIPQAPVIEVVKPTQTDNKPTKLNPVVNNTNETVTTLSNDNYIKDIDIVGYDILFDKDVNNYSIEVDNEVESLTLSIVLNDNKASYLITGNEKFKVGKNEIILTVLAEDGSSRDYIIEVNKKDYNLEKDNIDTDTDNKNLYEFVVLIVLIITILMIIYRLLKKDY